MSAPIKPDPNADGSVNADGGNNEPPNTPEPPAPNPNEANERRLEMMESLLREQHRTISTLQSTIEQERLQRQSSVVADEDEDASAFLNKPRSIIRDIVQKEINQAIEPLKQFTSTLKMQSDYDKLKNRYRNDPRFKDVFPKIENAVDNLMQNAPATEENMQLAVLAAVGSAHVGMISGVNLSTPPTPPKPGVFTPAHLKPSGAKGGGDGDGSDGGKKLRPLTELEARVARDNNLTHEAFLEWLDVEPSKVTTAKIGKGE